MRGQICFIQPKKKDGVSEAAAISSSDRRHALFFPIADGDDALAFAIPLEVVAERQLFSSMSCARRLREKTKRSHIFPEITLYSPLSV